MNPNDRVPEPVPTALSNAAARLPSQPGGPGNAGYDLHAASSGRIPPLSHTLVGTGLRLALPLGTWGLIRSRSGLSLRHSIEVGAGVIDQVYRGEIGVILYNHHATETFEYALGDRIAQLIVLPYIPCNFIQCPQLDETARGESGFGGSGV